MELEPESVGTGRVFTVTPKELAAAAVHDLAGHAAVVVTPGAVVARVGPVYTPPEHRGKRYGSAVTAAVVEHLLPEVDAIMLYTDASNPTSNAIYERIGFHHVDDIVDLDLEPV